MTKEECCEMALQELQHIERGEAKVECVADDIFRGQG